MFSAGFENKKDVQHGSRKGSALSDSQLEEERRKGRKELTARGD